MKNILYWFQGISFLFMTPLLLAQTVSDNGSVIPQNRLRITPAFSFTDIDYDVKGSNDDFSVDSQLLGIEVGKGIMPKLDISGQLLYMVNAHLDNCEGSGYALGVGGHYEAQREKRSRIVLNGQLSHSRQSFSCPDRAELRNSMTELAGSATYNYRLQTDWDVFGGLRLTPFSNGHGKNETNGANYDFKRDSIFSVILGGSTKLAGNRLRAELILFGETTFILGYSINLQ